MTAQDFAGLRSVLADAAASAAGPTAALVAAGGDEVPAAISMMFGNFGQEFHWLSAQAQAFNAEFVSLINAGAGAYVSAEIANTEKALANAVDAPAKATYAPRWCQLG